MPSGKLQLPIALDAMGGDNAPACVLRGAEMAIIRHPGSKFLMFGNRYILEPLLANMPQLKAACEIVHTEAVIAGDADAGPLDSYAHALFRATEPDLAARLRVIASTPPTAIPALVAAPSIAPAVAGRLTETLLAVHDAAWLAPARATLLLERFARVRPEGYEALLIEAERTDALGYPRIV